VTLPAPDPTVSNPSARRDGECPDVHNMVRFESLTASGVFCTRCDREEWDNGHIRPGWRYTP
jgi:hypothetical protein